MDLTQYIKQSTFMLKDRVLSNSLMKYFNIVIDDSNMGFGSSFTYSIESEYVPQAGETVDLANLSYCSPRKYKLVCDETGTATVPLDMHVGKATQFNQCIAKIIEQQGGVKAGMEMARRSDRLVKMTEADLVYTWITQKMIPHGIDLGVVDVTDADAIYTAIKNWDDDLDIARHPFLWSGSESVVPTVGANGAVEFSYLNEDKGTMNARTMIVDIAVFKKLIESQKFYANATSVNQLYNEYLRAGSVMIGRTEVVANMEIKSYFGKDMIGINSPLCVGITKCKITDATYQEHTEVDKATGIVEKYDLATAGTFGGADVIASLAFVYHSVSDAGGK